MLEITDHDSTRVLRLSRPPVNALNGELLENLIEGFRRAEEDANVRVLILTGAPGVLSAGLDVRALMRDVRGAKDVVLAFHRLQQVMVAGQKPVIAAISGHCPAGGTVLSLLCDQRVMVSGDFRIGLNEVQIGLYPGHTIFKIFERIVGPRYAADLLTRGAMLDPEAALQVGLVDELCAPDRLMDRAMARARELAALPPKTYARTRNLVRSELRALYASPQESFEDLLAEGWITDEAIARLSQLTRG